MMKLCSVLVVLGLAACSDSRGQELKTDRNSVEEDTISVEIENATDRTFHAIFLAPSGARSWGVNQLDQDLEPDDSLTLDLVPCDEYYDFKALGEGGVVIQSLETYFSCDTEPLITLKPN